MEIRNRSSRCDFIHRITVIGEIPARRKIHSYIIEIYKEKKRLLNITTFRIYTSRHKYSQEFQHGTYALSCRITVTSFLSCLPPDYHKKVDRTTGRASQSRYTLKIHAGFHTSSAAVGIARA